MLPAFLGRARFDSEEGKGNMGDVLLIITTVLFFVVAWAYTEGCDRL
jgi:hypothetical protein